MLTAAVCLMLDSDETVSLIAAGSCWAALILNFDSTACKHLLPLLTPEKWDSKLVCWLWKTWETPSNWITISHEFVWRHCAHSVQTKHINTGWFYIFLQLLQPIASLPTFHQVSGITLWRRGKWGGEDGGIVSCVRQFSCFLSRTTFQDLDLFTAFTPHKSPHS